MNVATSLAQEQQVPERDASRRGHPSKGRRFARRLDTATALKRGGSTCRAAEALPRLRRSSLSSSHRALQDIGSRPQ
jgi:hypothetical protein